MQPASDPPAPSAPSDPSAFTTPEPLQLEQLPNMLYEELQGWLELGVRMLPNIIAALLLTAIFGLLSRFAGGLARRALTRMKVDETVTRLLEAVVRLGLVAVGVFLALGMLNLDGVVASLLAGVGVVGLALGFAFQDIAANFMSGVIMAVSRPYKVGDLIESNGHFGRVEGIDLRTLQLRTLTGERVLIPNKDVYNSVLVNYTETPDRRVDVPVGVSYGENLRQVIEVTERALQSVDERDEARPVEVFFVGYGDSSIDLEARFWIRFHAQRDYVKARSAAVVAIKEHFDEAGITIPFPIRTLDFGAATVGGESLSGRTHLAGEG